MYQDVINFKPLFLSEEETMALLDLCLTSPTEIDEVKEHAIRKLSDLARSHMRATEDAIPTEPEPGACSVPHAAVVSTHIVGEALRLDGQPPATENLTPITMMARAMAHCRAPRRQMGAALADSRRRLRNSA